MTPLHQPTRAGLRRPLRIAVAVLGAGLIAATAACTDSNVPFFAAPTAVPNTPAGIQNAVSGLFAGSRNDVGSFEFNVVAGYARDGAVFTNTEPRTVTYPLGVNPIPNTSGGLWAQEYQNITQAQNILATIPSVAPAYTAAQSASLAGVIQTIQAYNYMLIAEAHDTLGVAILPAGLTGITAPPAVCSKDAWRYIVALLDTANDSLTTAGAVLAPVRLPTGFTGVYASSGPGTVAGSFASFNRALAAKANLELAYAIARTPTTSSSAPTPTSAGAPDVPSLTTALADLTASAMYAPSALGPTPSGQFKTDQYDVTHDFSAESGDLVNPVNAQIGTEGQLNDFVADVDTAHDLRWKAKFIVNPNPLQQPTYNPVGSKYLYNMYATPNAPVPIVREEQLVLWHAQIELGLGNPSAALIDVNAVRTTVGGLPPFPASVAATYTSMRDSLMKEQRISTTWESSADRTIAIRMYGLAVVADTTWEHEDPNVTTGDQHTTINPIPETEIDGRGGTFTTTCQ